MPTPEELRAVFKKQTAEPLATFQTSQKRIFLDTPYNNPRHAVPASIMPIVKAPFAVHDFFTDLDSYAEKEENVRHEENYEKVHAKPPAPPPAPLESPGIMVPFVYPPVVPIKPDVYLADEGGRRRNSHDHQFSWERRGISQEHVQVPMVPFPFPPPQYMPYPLIADRAPLTPAQVFEDWLLAAQHLPRVDMVVASAAGLIFDLGAKASSEGLTVERLDQWVGSRVVALDPEADNAASDSEPDVEKADLTKYLEYASQVDTRNLYDPYARPEPEKLVVYPELRAEYTRVLALVSDRSERRRSPVSPKAEVFSSSAIASPLSTYSEDFAPPEFPSSKDIVNAARTQKERRRMELYAHVRALERHSRARSEQSYEDRRSALLERLEALRNTTVSFDDGKTATEDHELSLEIENLQETRDMELLQLRHHYHVEKLRAASTFYSAQNRTYRGLTSLLINKLQKLRNFLHHQQQVFAEAPSKDVFNVRSKESANLAGGFVERDYANDVKSMFRAANINEDRGLPLDSHPSFDPEVFTSVDTSKPHTALVHDYMPLVTDEEFRLITGDAPAKTGPTSAKDAAKGRHKIFQNSLYSRATSGSDTNTSENPLATPKRRPGRKAAPKPLIDEPATQPTEAALVAKIMKHFTGLTGANAQELSDDLDQIGIKTRWPVK